MTRTRRSALTAMILCVLLVLTAAFSGMGTAARQDGDKVLRIHQVLYPETADPQKSSFSSEISFLVSNYEGLTRLDANGQTSPAAAERWEFNDDGTVLTFHLREGLTYSDGSPLTADRFVYAVKRACDPNTAGDYQYVLFDIAGCQEFASLYAEGDGAHPGRPGQRGRVRGRPGRGRGHGARRPDGGDHADRNRPRISRRWPGYGSSFRPSRS